jgi:serine/threonine protein kinase
LKNETYSRSADIFSFAVLLWEIMTQDEPYKDFKFSWDVADFVLQGKRLPLPQECSTHISELISQCWAQEPNDRPAIAEVVKTLEIVHASIK